MVNPHDIIKRLSLCSAVLISLFLAVATRAQPLTLVGPQNGWLVLHGGNTKPDNLAAHRFVELAGGAKASIVVVLTPIPSELITPEFLTWYKQFWMTEFGVSDVTFIDTRDRRKADTETFVAPLRKATGVWIHGGSNNILVDVYLGTLAEREIKAVADRGGVIGGSSAGAMIQGSFLVTFDSGAAAADSKKGIHLDSKRLEGFGVLKNVTVYPHFAERKAQWLMFRVLAQYPNLLGIGIDESTAIVVHDDQFEVIGQGHVEVFEASSAAKRKYLVLSKGQRYDLRQRKILN
jgi:cyanophycinase